MYLLSERVKRMAASLEDDRNRLNFKVACDPIEQQKYAELTIRARRETAGLPECRFRARLLSLFASEMPLRRDPDEFIHGSQRFVIAEWDYAPFVSPVDRPLLGPYSRGFGHTCVDYAAMLELSPAGLRRRIGGMPPSEEKTAFGEAIDAVRTYIGRHVDFAFLADRPPENFTEAMQMIWFTQVMLHVEAPACAWSFGRMGRYVSRFLSDDRQNDFDVYCDFCLKCCAADDSQNITLDGSESPRFAVMALEAARLLGVWQPSLTFAVKPEIPEDVWLHALQLALTGSVAMLAFFNSETVAASLAAAGIPPEAAKSWVIVGCYEASVQGNCTPMTVANGFQLDELLRNFMDTAPGICTFEAFIDGLKSYVAGYYRRNLLPAFNANKKSLREHCAMPLESILTHSCIERGKTVFDGGSDHTFYGVGMLGLGTLVDSLCAIKQLVFDTGELTLAEFNTILENDFPDETFRQRCLNLPGKFGTDSALSNRLAEDISAFLASEVLAHRLFDGSQPYPAFFMFLQDVYLPHRFATPDGRRKDDFLSYGVSPSRQTHTAPTATLNSSAHAAHRLAGCGCPLTLSFRPGDVDGKSLRALIEGYFAAGGSHVQFAVVSYEELRMAQKEPEKYPHLQIRVSGHSARFVALDKICQDAIIERTAHGR